MDLLKEKNYAENMQKVVIPFLDRRRTEGFFERIKGQNIYYRVFRADHPRADIVLVHGFTEGVDKFNETIYYFLQADFNVWQIQQRGHGRSFRAVPDPSLVYIEDYHDLVHDLHFFVTDIVKKFRQNTLPLYLFGHSMGGGVSAVYLETWPDDFSKAVLSSPMLELDSGNTPELLARIYAGVMNILGKGKNYMPGSSGFKPEPDFENSCSNSRARYDYWFSQVCEKKEYQTCASAIKTAMEFLKLTKWAVLPKNCRKVKADVLLFQAGKDNTVKAGGQETFIRQIGSHGKLLRMDNARHEIYMGCDEDLKIYWDKILEFFHA